jgi:uncharacterized protein YbjT (DUF2867 family)
MEELVKKILVVGATGYLGPFVVAASRRRGYEVRALVRDAGRAARLVDAGAQLFVGEATRPETLGGLCDGTHWVFSSLRITRQRDGLTYQGVDFGATKAILDLAR